MKVALIPVGDSDWQIEGRLLGRVELPLAPQGIAHATQWAAELRDAALSRILHGPDELAKQTARTLAAALRVTVRSVDELAEVDVGLWAGLTADQLESRFASAYHELLESPLNVSPPEGEPFADALRRLQACLRRRIRRNGAGTVGVVLRPLALALLRFTLAPTAERTIWQDACSPAKPEVFEYPPAAGQA